MQKPHEYVCRYNFFAKIGRKRRSKIGSDYVVHRCQITFGEHFRFTPAGADLPDPPSVHDLTGRWQNVGEGSVNQPRGGHALTSAQLMASYAGADLADTWVWQTRMDAAIIAIIAAVRELDWTQIPNPRVVREVVMTLLNCQEPGGLDMGLTSVDGPAAAPGEVFITLERDEEGRVLTIRIYDLDPIVIEGLAAYIPSRPFLPGDERKPFAGYDRTVDDYVFDAVTDDNHGDPNIGNGFEFIGWNGDGRLKPITDGDVLEPDNIFLGGTAAGDGTTVSSLMEMTVVVQNDLSGSGETDVDDLRIMAGAVGSFDRLDSAQHKALGNVIEEHDLDVTNRVDRLALLIRLAQQRR